MVDGLVAAVDLAQQEANILVLAAEPPAFCAGAELAGLQAGIAGDFAGIEHVYRAFLRMKDCPIPTIAAVGGAAVGAGLNLALACDVRIASDEAVFESRFTRMHLHPGGGHSWMLERLIGPQTTAAMVVLGAPVSARQALKLGLVWSVHPATELVDAALALAASAGGQDAAFVRQLLGTVRSVTTVADHATAVDHERYAQRWSISQDAFRDGIARMRKRIEERHG
jgi:enoyl-CoA hydratase